MVASFSQHFVSQSELDLHTTAAWPAFALYSPAWLRRLLLHVTVAHVAVGFALQQLVFFAAAVVPGVLVSFE